MTGVQTCALPIYGQALSYAIAVGKAGYAWSGINQVTDKREWPEWTPPGEMLQRRPDLPRHMAGGPDNPMGARAIYLGASLYRIHGSNGMPWSDAQTASPLTLSVPGGSDTVRARPTPRNWMVPMTEPSP